MQPRPLAMGLFTWDIGGYYYGAMLSGIHQVTRAAGVPLLIIQSELKDIRMPTFGSEYVAGWIALHPSQDAAANLVALVASGVPVITVATRLDDVACTSVVADNRGGTRMLVNHLLDHGHRQIAYIDHGKESWSYERYLGYLDALQDHAIALDPGLIIDIAYIHTDLDAPRRLERCGEVTAQELIARGLPCTALVAGTDRSAIAAIQVLQDAGYHVPEDIAVVGFDDVAEAQFAQPPLTTVRTRFDQLGRIAAEELLAVLRGEHDPHPRRIYAPSSLLRRRSCGCLGLTAIQERGTQAVATAVDWQPMLAKQLVQLICYPLASELDTPPAQLWPGVSTLIAAVDALLQGQDTASFAADIDAAWQQAVALTDNLELLNATVVLLEDITEQRASPTAGTAVAALLRQFRMAMLRARLGHEATKNQYLTQSSWTNRTVSLALLSSQVGESQSLAWLHTTSATWGCLGCWAAASRTNAATITITGIYQTDQQPLPAIGSQYPATAFPPIDALPWSARQGHDLTILLPLHAGADDLGVLALCGFANRNFTLDTESLWVQAALLAATLKRDAMVGHLEAQGLVLAQARDAAEAANAELELRVANRTAELMQANVQLREQISERQRAEAALLAERNLLRTLIDHLPDSIYIKDQQSRFVLANRAFLDVLGLSSAEQLLGKSDADFFPPDMAAQFAADERAIFETGQALINHEESVVHPRTSARRWVVSSKVPVRATQGQVVGLVGMTRDITEHRSLQAQLLQAQKMESIGRLAGGIAHDFNNLLTAIVGYAELALATLTPEDLLHDDLQGILNATERATALTRQLLAFARKQVLAPQVLDLNELILNLDKLLRRLIGENVELEVREAPCVVLVKADPHQLEQVLLNLAINARDAMPDGGRLTIEIATVAREPASEGQDAQDRPGNYAMLAVNDTGLGMPPEVQAHLFEPFFTTKEVGKGTGLGLATCYGIVKQHGGQIEASSTLGQGTSIKVYLPCVSEAAPLTHAHAAARHLQGGTETILLVEDEHIVRQLAMRVLQKLGYTVLEAADGTEALRMAQRHSERIDLLLTDIVMPHMNGNALAESVRAIHPQLKVLFISGYSDCMLSQQHLTEQKDALLQKPFTPDLLARTVRDILDM